MSAPTKIVELARLLVEQFLQPRRVLLSKRAPKCPEVHQLERNLSADRIKPIEMLLRMDFAKVEDGLSVTQALQWIESYRTFVEEHAAEVRARRAGADLSIGAILAANQRETRAEGILNVAQNDLIANPDNPDAMDSFLAASANYETVNDDLVAKVRTRRARATLRGQVLTA